MGLNSVQIATCGKLQGFTTANDTKSVRQRLRESIIYNLKQITIANGYTSTVKRVYDPPVSMENMRDYPSINIHWGREDREPDIHLQGNNSLVNCRFFLTIDAFLYTRNDPAQEQDKIIADVQKMIGDNFYLVDELGNRTAFNALYSGSSVWGTDTTKPNCGASIELEIWYTYVLNNPYSIL